MNNDIKQIGTKVYYCNITGNMQDYVKETNFDEDCVIYNELSERGKETIGCLTYAFGEFEYITNGATGYTVDLKTNQLILTFEPLPEIPIDPSRVYLLEGKISILEKENKKLKEVTKDQDNLLVDNAYKITMLEMNLGGK